MEIYGNVISIEKYATQKTPGVYKIKNLEDDKNYKISYLGFCPVQSLDSIKGTINALNEFENKPLVVPVETEEYLKQSLFKALKNAKFGYRKCENLIDELKNTYTTIEKIYQKLNSWASDEASNPTLDSISKGQSTKFLEWWKKNFLFRRLYLLGLNNREIKSSFTSLDDLYNDLTTNPFKIHSISIEKAKEINDLLGKNNKNNDIIGGKITRYIYQSSWTSTPFSYIAKGFPEIYVCLDYIKDNYPLVFEDKFVYSKYCHDMEIFLANKITALLIKTDVDKLESVNLPKIVNQVQVDKDIILTEEQHLALEGCLSNHISIVTGGAGCGKTTLIKQIVRNLIYRKDDFVLTSFTGKAVLRIKEVVGKDLEKNCLTISLLIQKKKFRLNPPKFKTLVIDEASMISGALMYDLCKLYNHNFKIILIGDSNQLPPIGLCSFFKEIIISGKIPVYYLTINKRILNNEKSANILVNANLLIKKDRDLIIPFKYLTGKGFEIIEGEKNVVYDIINALSKSGVNMEEITVLTPYNKDIDEINNFVQKIYLKDIPVYRYANIDYIIGDRMMQTTNVYSVEGEIMNGEEGIIIGITSDELTIRFSEEKIINYTWSDNKKFKDYKNDEDVWDIEKSEHEFLSCDLKHSFCKTVHKSQGSEYTYVIIFLPESKSSFVNINLLYTAITRTKKTVWMVVDKENLTKASGTKLGFRCDRLSDRIRELNI
jgi:hypothetical protein